MFWNTLVQLCNENNTTPTALVKSLGIAAGSVTKWKGGAYPRSTTAKKIADHFGVSVDYLLGNTDKKEKPNVKDDGLSDGERAWLELYHKLSAETREILIGAMQSYDQLSEERKSLALQMLRIALDVQ